MACGHSQRRCSMLVLGLVHLHLVYFQEVIMLLEKQIIFETAGNAVDHADLSVAKEQGATFASTTSFFDAGGDSGSKVQQIDTIAVSSTGTASDFGDLIAALNESHGGFSSPTRGFIHGGQTD